MIEAWRLVDYKRTSQIKKDWETLGKTVFKRIVLRRIIQLILSYGIINIKI